MKNITVISFIVIASCLFSTGLLKKANACEIVVSRDNGVMGYKVCLYLPDKKETCYTTMGPVYANGSILSFVNSYGKVIALSGTISVVPN